MIFFLNVKNIPVLWNENNKRWITFEPDKTDSNTWRFKIKISVKGLNRSENLLLGH